jgi:hypothetical protein
VVASDRTHLLSDRSVSVAIESHVYPGAGCFWSDTGGGKYKVSIGEFGHQCVERVVLLFLSIDGSVLRAGSPQQTDVQGVANAPRDGICRHCGCVSDLPHPGCNLQL